MSDLGDALWREAEARADASGDRVGNAAGVADAARRARGRRVRGAGAMGLVGVVAVGAGAWMLAPEPPLPAMQVADGVVSADVPPVPPDFRGLTCYEEGFEPYVPWAEPGVTIASAEVQDLGIHVDATPYLLEWGDNEVDAEELEPGGVVNLAVPEDLIERPELLAVQFDVSWDSDALYQVAATAFVTAGERVVSEMGGWDAEGWWGGDRPDFLAEAAAQDGMSSVSLTSVPDHVSCAVNISGDFDDQADVPVPAGQLELHTLVQIKSEDGEPLATFVDAVGLDGTSVQYGDGAPEDPMVLDPIEPSELEYEALQRSMLEPVASFDAALRDALEADGEPLREAGVGFVGGQYYQCARPGGRLLDEPILPFAGDDASERRSLVGVLPAALPLDELKNQRVMEIEVPESSEVITGSMDAQLVFLDQDGVAVASHNVFYGNTGNAATLDFEHWSDCADIAALEVGETYGVVAMLGDLGLSALDDDIREAYESGSAGAITRVEYVGEVTFE
ncbi:hypothetical protein [Demequina flava]|uniref:hypothetical protein n=1 Tax=Demequina flava TaxID=1095025 RepID=UPI000784AB82|nr:hypothetical protein [Demequina flava]